jgi:predicted Zn-ribbon and HTH transcriptional regulator
MKNEKELLSQRIISYLKKHPEAGDTLEGIVTWWLEQERIDRVVDDVADVLRSLEKKGTVLAHRTQAGTTIYKIKR